mgnify:FL=1
METRIEVVVTRHQGLVQYLREAGIIDGSVRVVAHATPENVRGRHVLGVLPHSLSCLCESFTEVPLNLPADMRGKELTAEDVRQFAGQPVTYTVRVVPVVPAGRPCTCGSGEDWADCAAASPYCG